MDSNIVCFLGKMSQNIFMLLFRTTLLGYHYPINQQMQIYIIQESLEDLLLSAKKLDNKNEHIHNKEEAHFYIKEESLEELLLSSKTDNTNEHAFSCINPEKKG